MPTARGLLGLSAAALLLAGCAHTVDGTARSTQSSSTSTLGPVLLSVPEINTIMGTTDMELSDSAEDIADDRAGYSDLQCLGPLAHAQAAVYDGTGWTEVADQIVTAPDGDLSGWVQQSAVRLPSPERAEKSLDSSKETWTNCIGKAVTVNDDVGETTWRLEGVTIDDVSVSQTSRMGGGDEWSCRHVLRAASAVIIEVTVCGTELHAEAADLAAKIAARVD